MESFSPLANCCFIPLFGPVKLFRRMLILLLLATVFATLQGFIRGLPDASPKMDPWGLSLEAALAMEPVLWVDARAEKAFSEMHFPGAVHFSKDDFDGGLNRLLENWAPEMSVVVYCDGDGCESSRALAAELRDILAEERIYWLAGGWEELKEAID